MKNPKTNQFLALLLCLLLTSACQNREKQSAKEGKEQDYTYQPEKGRLTIVSETDNPELERVVLFRDNEKDSVTSVKPEEGKFKLEVDDITANEVYFLKLTGTSTKQGTSGLKWDELVPVLSTTSKELELVQQAFNDVGSISKVKFSIDGGGDEQELLNDWHASLVELQAEEEGQMEHYAIGGSGATKVADKKASSKSQASITQEFVDQQKPLISSFYLISRLGKHRQHAEDYQNLLDNASEQAQKSKYGLILAKHLDQLGAKVEQLDLEKQVVATDTRLSEIPWDSFKDRKYLLLSFWNSSDGPSAQAAKELKGAASELEPKGIDVLLIAVDDQFSKWQEAAKELDFKYNYKMRNEAKQPLVDTLYLSELPRLVLVKPDGEVVDDDLSLEQVKALE
ncbi:redoxin domain-containing protein [Olivibacter sp. SDN3]|uniref:thioredoxin family protein n=1 Tax=Olivibacter sp. SDN3 TaxID=2764720 RepID=UPI0016512508|nr:thioredoxin family protein [Olivibacter sp. SDN3]QNL49643.1 redoxin domain-containing protein [Olivibacter sp. SDN3]